MPNKNVLSKQIHEVKKPKFPTRKYYVNKYKNKKKNKCPTRKYWVNKYKK